MSNTLQLIGPDTWGVTLQIVNDRMNDRFNEIKQSNPRGFMDEWDMRRDVILLDIAEELHANLRVIDDVDSEGKACEGFVFIHKSINADSIIRQLTGKRDEQKARTCVT